ncbi:hypothetical protein ABK040_005676 [Willaertia magna]
MTKADIVASSSQEQQPNTSSSKKDRKRKPYVKRACINCHVAHVACDSERPCRRCKKKGLTCVDYIPTKKTKTTNETSNTDGGTNTSPVKTKKVKTKKSKPSSNGVNSENSNEATSSAPTTNPISNQQNIDIMNNNTSLIPNFTNSNNLNNPDIHTFLNDEELLPEDHTMSITNNNTVPSSISNNTLTLGVPTSHINPSMPNTMVNNNNASSTTTGATTNPTTGNNNTAMAMCYPFFYAPLFQQYAQQYMQAQQQGLVDGTTPTAQPNNNLNSNEMQLSQTNNNLNTNPSVMNGNNANVPFFPPFMMVNPNGGGMMMFPPPNFDYNAMMANFNNAGNLNGQMNTVNNASMMMPMMNTTNSNMINPSTTAVQQMGPVNQLDTTHNNNLNSAFANWNQFYQNHTNIPKPLTMLENTDDGFDDMKKTNATNAITTNHGNNNVDKRNLLELDVNNNGIVEEESVQSSPVTLNNLNNTKSVIPPFATIPSPALTQTMTVDEGSPFHLFDEELNSYFTEDVNNQPSHDISHNGVLPTATIPTFSFPSPLTTSMDMQPPLQQSNNVNTSGQSLFGKKWNGRKLNTSEDDIIDLVTQEASMLHEKEREQQQQNAFFSFENEDNNNGEASSNANGNFAIRLPGENTTISKQKIGELIRQIWQTQENQTQEINELKQLVVELKRMVLS